MSTDNNNTKSYQDGLLLIEILFAVFVITVAIGGAFALIRRNVLEISFLENKAIAIGLAQEGMEAVFNIHNSNSIAGFEGENDQWGNPITFTSYGLNRSTCGPQTAKGGCEIECVTTGEGLRDCITTSDLPEIMLSQTYTNDLFRNDPTTGWYELASGSCNLPSCLLSSFRRKIVVDEVASADCPVGECLEILVVVSWDERGVTYTVEAESRLYNWVGI